jgi:hypothetical protein
MKSTLLTLFIMLFSLSIFAQAPSKPTIPGLPPGTTMSSTGLITGTPTALGTYVANIQACDSESPIQCSDITPVTIPVYGAVVIGPPTTLPFGIVGTPYSQQIPISGGVPPYTVTIQP